MNCALKVPNLHIAPTLLQCIVNCTLEEERSNYFITRATVDRNKSQKGRDKKQREVKSERRKQMRAGQKRESLGILENKQYTIDKESERI